MQKIIQLERREYADWHSAKLKKAFNTGLRVVILNSMGSDPFPIESARGIGLTVKTLPDYCSDELSNHAFRMLITLARKVHYKGFSDKTVLVIGSEGNVGRKIVLKCKERNFKVLKHDLVFNHTERNLKIKLPKADFVFLCIPVVRRTKNFLNKKHFVLMKKKPLIVNVSGRLLLVNNRDLISALKQNQIRGYACDESVYDRRFFYYDDRLLFTPHIGWISSKSEKKRELFLKSLWLEAKEELNLKT